MRNVSYGPWGVGRRSPTQSRSAKVDAKYLEAEEAKEPPAEEPKEPPAAESADAEKKP